MSWTPKGWTGFGAEYRKEAAGLLVEMVFLRVFLPKEAVVDPSLRDRAVSFCPCAAVVVASPGSPETAPGGKPRGTRLDCRWAGGGECDGSSSLLVVFVEELEHSVSLYALLPNQLRYVCFCVLRTVRWDEQREEIV
jgi:hypothetical protein